MEVSKIKILLVDDSVVWTKEMVKMLNRYEEFDVVGVAHTKNEAVNLAKNLDVDIILMDINLSEDRADGITATVEISLEKNIKTIMLTSLNDEELIINSFTAGATNYISKEKYRDIPNIIRRTYYEKSPFDVLVKSYQKLKEEEQVKDLNITEKEVFESMRAGHSRSQMTEILNKTESTIKKQIKQILQKLKVKNSKEAIEKVKRRGL